MGSHDALLIFPEGGNFTERRRELGIERLREAGLEEAAERAGALEHLLPPRPGGVGAALRAAPTSDVVVVAHTGLEQLTDLRALWRDIPVAKTLYVGLAGAPRQPRCRPARQSSRAGCSTGGPRSTRGSTR